MKIKLPSGWKVDQCKNIIDVRDGTHDTPKYCSSGYPLVTSKNLKPEGIDFSTVSYIAEEDHYEISKRSKVDRGDILFAMIGTIGNPVIVNVDTEFSIKNVALFKFAKSSIDAKYFKYLLETPIITQQLDCGQRGGTQKFVSLKVLRDMLIPYPPLEEQYHIAAILDKADAVRRKRQQAIALTEELLRSAFLNLVSSKHPTYHEWKEVSLADLALPTKGSMRTGPFGSTLRHSEFVEEGVAVLGIDNAVQNRFAWGESRFITPEKYKGLRQYTVKPGDVIITIMGTTGRSAVVPQDIPTAITTKHLATITLDSSKALPEYISNAIHRDPSVLHQIALQNRGAIMAGLNLGIIKKLKVRLPPLEQQILFDKVVNQIRQQQEKVERVANTTNNLFNSLLQKAFEGEL